MSNNTSYDKALLDEAPEVTPQQRQRFYDADLLYDDANRERQRTGADGAPLSTGGAAPTRSNTDLEAGNGGASDARSKEYVPLPPPTVFKIPWYKTRKGIIGLVVLAIVIIGAVVGGAVGGTQGNKNSNKNESAGTSSGSASQLPPSISPSSSTSTSSQVAGQGGGSVPITSGTEAAPAGTTTAPAQATAVAVADNPV